MNARFLFSPSARLLFALAILFLLPGCDFVGGLTGGGDDGPEETYLFPVQLDGEWGYINASGRIMIEPQFQWAGPFEDGRAHVRASWRHGYIDAQGEFVVEPRFEDARDFSEGLAAVKLAGRWGFIDRSGAFAINPQFTSSGAFREGRAFLRDDSYTWNYIDTEGRVVRSVDTPEMAKPDDPHFSNGLALVMDEDREMFGYVNKNGEPVIAPQYASARGFSDGLAAVKVSDRWGFIDTDQRTVINPRFIEAGMFNDGRAPVRENTNTWGFIDRDGRMVIDPAYEEARTFSDGLAAVQMLGLWGFVSTDGDLVISAQFETVDDFDRGLARVEVEVPDPNRDNQTITRIGYLDRHGDYVWYPTS